MKQVRKLSLLGVASAMCVVGVGVTGAGAAPARVAHATQAHVVKIRKLSFSATYLGTVKILWTSTGASGTMSATGKATTLGTGSLVATGATKSFSTSSSSDPLSGTAVLKGAGGSLSISALNVSAATTAAAAPTSSAPDPVVISGTVKVTKGTGKFAGAKGTLNVHATFSVNTTTGAESQSFVTTLKGTLSVKA